MKRASRALLLFLLGAVVCAAATPPRDVPETSYNESDKLIIQSSPVAHAVRLVAPAYSRVLAGSKSPHDNGQVESELDRVPPELVWWRRSPQSFRELLCILII